MSDWLFRTLYRSRMNTFAGIPGPPPTFPFGNALAFMGNKKRPWEVCADWGREYGGMTLVWLLGQPAIVLNDPQLIGEVLETNWQAFYKDAPHDALAPVIAPDNVFIANGDNWRFLRDNSPMCADWFDGWLRSQVPVIRDIVRRRIRTLAASGQTVDLVDELRRLSYDVLSLTTWGREFGDRNYQNFLRLATVGSRRMNGPPPLSKLPPLLPSFYSARTEWYGDFSRALAEARRDVRPDATDLLRETLRRGTPLNDRQLAWGLAAPVHFGGVFSLASALATTLYLLNQNPNAAQAVDGEVSERVIGREPFDHAALESCEQVDFALREALRVSGPVPMYFRNVSRENSVQLGGHTLPPNTLLFITNWLLHRDPEHWPDADRFLPAR